MCLGSGLLKLPTVDPIKKEAIQQKGDNGMVKKTISKSSQKKSVPRAYFCVMFVTIGWLIPNNPYIYIICAEYHVIQLLVILEILLYKKYIYI